MRLVVQKLRTDFPDGTYSKVEFTPWMQKSYDQNDTTVGNPHFDTPTETHLDSLGRTFYVVANDGKGQKPITRTVLDIEGNESKIFDARGNAVMEYRYGIHGEKGYTKSMDSGERWMMLAVDGQPLYTWDSRNHRLHAAFDELRRPTEQRLLEDYTQGGSEILVGKTVYGETASNPTASNLRGKPWKAYDQSGLTESVAYDFKGNLLESRRQFTTVYNATIDWNFSPALESETFTTLTAYDALNRATSIKTPHNANIPASEVLPTYNEASLLEAVNVKLRGATTATNFVSNIDYDAKGQRERIQYGNGATTRYSYDPKTFRLTQLFTTRNSGVDILQDLNYSYDPVGNITQIVDKAQQTVYFNGTVVSPSQIFEYDALYRLTKATGREHVGSDASTEPENDSYSLAQSPMPSDATALRTYLRKWEYDSVGNILEMVHRANSGDWSRSYGYGTTDNRLQSTTVGQTTVNYAHNVHGSMTSMPHLQSMDWDFAERLSHVTRGSGSGSTEAYCNYDGSGQRSRKVVVKNGITETRLYLGGFEIFRKYVAGALDAERETLHVMDDKKRIALVETLTVENGSPVANLVPVQRYQLDNHLGSASLELDETANVVSYEEYYPYGDTSYQSGRSASEVSQKRYRYTGKEKDEESGLYYHGARYYACWLGRWTASDPAGLVDGVNLYMYVRGNPVKGVDSNGKWTDQDLLTKLSQNGMMEPSTTAVAVPRVKPKISSSSSSSSSSSASSATNSKSSSTATPSKPTSKPEWRQREPGFRDRLEKEGGPISFLFKIGYDITDELFLSGQRAKNTILRSDNDEFRLNGDFATNTEVQDALVNMMLLGIPEAKGLTSTGKAIEKGVGAEAKVSVATEPSSLAYRPTSGVQLQANEGKTTTILGSYNNDMKSILDELGNVKSTDFGPREGSFNVLNVPDDMYVSPNQFWADYNMPWLSNAIERGDNFLMATKPAFDVMDVESGLSILARPNPITGQMELSGFGREYLMMRRAGYNYKEGVMVK